MVITYEINLSYISISIGKSAIYFKAEFSRNHNLSHTKKENEFKKLVTLFTLGLFSVSPISLHILKQLGITKEAKLITSKGI